MRSAAGGGGGLGRSRRRVCRYAVHVRSHYLRLLSLAVGSLLAPLFAWRGGAGQTPSAATRNMPALHARAPDPRVLPARVGQDVPRRVPREGVARLGGRRDCGCAREGRRVVLLGARMHEEERLSEGGKPSRMREREGRRRRRKGGDRAHDDDLVTACRGGEVGAIVREAACPQRIAVRQRNAPSAVLGEARGQSAGRTRARPTSPHMSSPSSPTARRPCRCSPLRGTCGDRPSHQAKRQLSASQSRADLSAVAKRAHDAPSPRVQVSDGGGHV